MPTFSISFRFFTDSFHHLLSSNSVLFNHEFWAVTIGIHLTGLVDFRDFPGFLLEFLKMVNLVVEKVLNNWCIRSLKLIQSIEDLIKIFLENICLRHKLVEHLQTHFSIGLLSATALNQVFDLFLRISSFLEWIVLFAIRDWVRYFALLVDLEVWIRNVNWLHMLRCIILCGVWVQIWTLCELGWWFKTRWTQERQLCCISWDMKAATKTFTHSSRVLIDWRVTRYTH